MFREALNLDVRQDCPEVFFTNFVLGYRNKGTSGNFKKDWVDHDKGFFRELAELIAPKVILCLGRSTFEGVLAAFGKQAEVRIRQFNRFIESEQNPVPVDLENGKTAYVFALAHCGAMGTLNRNDKKNTELTTQIQDWKRIKPYCSDNQVG